jgi:hypothetical protein
VFGGSGVEAEVDTAKRGPRFTWRFSRLIDETQFGDNFFNYIYIYMITHPYEHIYAHPIPMRIFKRLSRFDLKIHEVGHQECLYRRKHRLPLKL